MQNGMYMITMLKKKKTKGKKVQQSELFNDQTMYYLKIYTLDRNKQG